MKPAKRKKLEDKGWKIGTAADFLGLSLEEAWYVEFKLNLAKALKKRRNARRLTQAECAKILGSSQSRVAKMEAADPTVSIDLLFRSLMKLRADGVTTAAETRPRIGRKPGQSRR